VIIVPGILGSWKVSGKWVLDPILNTYNGLYETLAQNGFEEEKMLFAFPYNWRNDNAETARLLKQRIDEVKIISGSNKVDIVAHSMGGLVARSYAQSDYHENDIDQIIFLGTPHLGAPKTYPIWESGDVGFVTDSTIAGYLLMSNFVEEAIMSGYFWRDGVYLYIKEKVKSVQQLLPIYNYLKNFGSEDYLNYPNNYPHNTFLEDLSSKRNILDERNINITNIVGDTGQNTIGGFNLQESKTYQSLPFWENGEPRNYYSLFGKKEGLNYVDGDGTVPFLSQNEFLSNTIVKSNINHSGLPSFSTGEILSSLNVLTPSIKYYDVVTNALIIAAYSPVDFYVVSPDNKKIGFDASSGHEFSEIINAFYSGNGSENFEFVVIPNPLEGKYTIMVEGTGNGNYEIKSTYINENNDSYSSSSYYDSAFMGSHDEVNIIFNSEKIISAPSFIVGRLPEEKHIGEQNSLLSLTGKTTNILQEVANNKKFVKEVKGLTCPLEMEGIFHDHEFSNSKLMVEGFLNFLKNLLVNCVKTIIVFVTWLFKF
jgi:hypothetical protein